VTARSDENWVTYGLCREADPDMWDMSAEKSDRVAAMRICRECPVLAQCFEDARDNPPYGLIQAGLGWRGGQPVDAVTGHRKGGSPSISAKKEGNPPPPHGTVRRYSMAEYRCRCPECKAAKSAARAKSAKRVAARRLLPVGDLGYERQAST
jgi:hypothetical protein